ncbi:MAG TPA: hypothetical protein VFA18_20095 [Gemmataceae bacterium]|nr:hypothetical protein [Gemmataceae bacterium]
MPPRLLTGVIVAFWVVTTAWFVQREVVPRFQSSERPPFTIDLASEAEIPRSGIVWDVFWKGQTVGHATTYTKWVADQKNYEVENDIEFDNFKYELAPFRVAINLKELRTQKWLSSTGELEELQGKVVASFSITGASADGWVKWRGFVSNGTFQPHWEIDSPLFGKRELTTDPVAVPNDYSTLNPLEPWNRLYHVEPGQRWRITRFDPLVQSLSAMANITPEADYLEAGVLQDPQELNWDGKVTNCLVIEYRGKNEVARTFVRQSDGLVLRQEVETQRPDLQDNDPDKIGIFALQRRAPDIPGASRVHD